MKKLGLVLVLLLSVGLIGVFADGPTIGSYIETEANVAEDGISWGPAGWGAADDLSYVSFTLSWAGENSGFTGTAITGLAALPTAWRNWKVYYNFFDGMAKASVGKLREGDYRFTDFIPGYNGGSGFMSRVQGPGVLLQLMPVDGLSIGASVPLPDATNAFADAFGDMDIYASYTIADVAKIVAAGLLGDAFSFYVGADIMAVENLDANFVFTYADDSTLGLSAGYAAGDIYAALRADLTFATAFGWAIAVGAEYTGIEMVTPQLYFSYADDGAYYVEAVGNFPAEAGSFTTGFTFGDGAWGVPLRFEFFF